MSTDTTNTRICPNKSRIQEQIVKGRLVPEEFGVSKADHDKYVDRGVKI